MSRSQEERRAEIAAQKAYARARPTNLTPTPTFVNASSRQPYVPQAWQVRAGADDHMQHQSAPMAAQIARVA